MSLETMIFFFSHKKDTKKEIAIYWGTWESKQKTVECRVKGPEQETPVLKWLLAISLLPSLQDCGRAGLQDTESLPVQLTQCLNSSKHACCRVIPLCLNEAFIHETLGLIPSSITFLDVIASKGPAWATWFSTSESKKGEGDIGSKKKYLIFIASKNSKKTKDL